MPGRQAHGGAPVKKAKYRVNNKKRSINAFAIASKQTEDRVKVRKHRLGESEGGKRPNKRPRNDDDGEDETEQPDSKESKKRPKKGRFDELDIDTGSDSEGNQWRLGQVDSDDDSDLDSDNAFGESDEERFDGFAFSGSSKKAEKEKKRSVKDITLNEAESDTEEASDSDDLGDDAIDLAAMLDATEDEAAIDVRDRGEKNGTENADGSLDGTLEDSDDDAFSSEEDDESDPKKMVALQKLIRSLPQARASEDGPLHQRHEGASEFGTPSEFGFTPKAKLQLEDLGLPSVRDPFVKKSLKLLASQANTTGNLKGTSGKLAVPLAKRQQDRLDRSAAYEKSKEMLDRWTDTVKHNRRAEHLVFPLQDADAISMTTNNRLQTTNTIKPFNELEATIQSILEESGLIEVNGKDGEHRMKEFEELEANKMTVEEVRARRDQLRMARELLFREEARSKRIKKIKSKSYRKVHRKQREKEERMNKEALIEAGIDPSEDEREAQDRRRATERMGDKHRGSKWAKTTKAIGRAAWDEDTRAGVTEMARRDEELRKRVEGQISRQDSEDESESPYNDSGDDSDYDAKQGQRLLQKLDKLSNNNDSGTGSKLSNMKFMLRAEAARKFGNDQTLEQIRAELAGEEEANLSDNDSVMDAGRQTFGPRHKQGDKSVKQLRKIANADHDGPDDGQLNERTSENHSSGSQGDKMTELGPGSYRLADRASAYKTTIASSEGGAWSHPATKKGETSRSTARRKKDRNIVSEVDEIDFSNSAVVAKQALPKKGLKLKAHFVGDNDVNEESDEVDDPNNLPYAVRDQDLIKRAFAGADVVGDFEVEKRQVIQAEDEKVVDNTVPGWGNWTGEGLSKREKQKNKGRLLSTVAGIKEHDRKDAKLERVIINERRVKKNGKYLASNLPHPFETRQQYERSLRLPVGPEWTTKETFQNATKPRVLVRQGIIAPMSKPLL